MSNPTLALSYQPVLPVWVIAAAVLTAVLLSAWLALKHEGFAVSSLLRLLGIGALGWALLNPVVEAPSTIAGSDRPRVTVLVDTSASMAQRDAGPSEDLGRLAYARQTWLSAAGLSQIADWADVDIRAFDEAIVAGGSLDDSPTGRATQLFDAVAQATGDLVVVVSDGHDTTGRGLPTLAANGPTVFAVPVGAARAAPDLSVLAWAENDYLYAGQSTRLTAQLYQRGLGGQSATVELLHEGEPVDQQRVQLDTSLSEVGFEVRPELPANQPGQVHAYTLRVALDDGEEASTQNNRQDVFVQVSRDKVRVLILEGEPHWETRGLSRVLSASPRFEVSGRYALGDQRRLRVAPPALGEETPQEVFAGYDVVVLGRAVERLLTPSEAQQLTQFVQQQGGAVVFARGRPTGQTDVGNAVLAELAAIAPVDFGRERPVAVVLAEAVGAGAEREVLSQLGGRLTWTDLPGMLAVTEVSGRRAASVVLLETRAGDGDPQGESRAAAVVTLRAGRGATMAVLTDGMWRWDLAGNADSAADDGRSISGADAYATFWTRATQWLASGGEFLPGQDVAMQLSAMTTQPGEPVRVTVSTRYVDAEAFAPRLVVTDPQGEQTELAATPGDRPGVLQYEMMPDQEGVYRFALSTPDQPDLVPADQSIESRLIVADRAVEYRDTAARPDVLKQLTGQTGGRCLEVDEYEPLLEALDTLALTRASDPQQRPVFNRWPVFALIGGSMGLHWLLRRRGGLL